MKSSGVFFVGLLCLLASSHAPSASIETRIIDNHGKQIPSIFFGIFPNPKLGPEYYQSLKAKRESLSSCSVVNAVYRESDGKVRLQTVQAG